MCLFNKPCGKCVECKIIQSRKTPKNFEQYSPGSIFDQEMRDMSKLIRSLKMQANTKGKS